MAAPKKKTATEKAAAKKPLEYLYVPLGAGQFLVEKARELGGGAVAVVKDRRKIADKTYRELAGRGERLVRSIRRSAATRQAMDQTRAARSRMKAAATSVGKAVGSTAEATREAAKKVG